MSAWLFKLDTESQTNLPSYGSWFIAAGQFLWKLKFMTLKGRFFGETFHFHDFWEFLWWLSFKKLVGLCVFIYLLLIHKKCSLSLSLFIYQMWYSCFYVPSYFVGTTKGFYMYIETSSPRKANETARLSSITFRSSGRNDSCYMRFWYHMFGQDVDTLSIKLKTSVVGPLKTIWNRTGIKMSPNTVNAFWLCACSLS